MIARTFFSGVFAEGEATIPTGSDAIDSRVPSHSESLLVPGWHSSPRPSLALAAEHVWPFFTWPHLEHLMIARTFFSGVFAEGEATIPTGSDAIDSRVPSLSESLLAPGWSSPLPSSARAMSFSSTASSPVFCRSVCSATPRALNEELRSSSSASEPSCLKWVVPSHSFSPAFAGFPLLSSILFTWYLPMKSSRSTSHLLPG